MDQCQRFPEYILELDAVKEIFCITVAVERSFLLVGQLCEQFLLCIIPQPLCQVELAI